MNRKSILVISITLLLILLFTSCAKEVKPEKIEYDFGVIYTVAHKEKSIINYYTWDGNLVKSEKLHLAWLDMGFGSFGETNENIYVKVDNKDGTIWRLNKENGLHNLYDLSFNSLTISAEEDIIYFANSNTSVSTISKYNVTTNQLGEIQLDKSITSVVFPFRENLYVSTYSKKDKSTLIYILDKDDLSIIDKFKNPLNSNIFRINGTGEQIYFANSSDFDSGNGINILTEYNIVENKYTNYTLETDYLYEIFEYEDNLIITHLNPPLSEGKVVTLFDLKQKSFNTISLENNLLHCTIKDDMFITCDMEYIYIYNLPSFQLLNKFPIAIDGYYISTLFRR